MYCKHCGKEIDDGAKFCKYCGKSQGDARVADTQKSTKATNNKLYKKWWFWLIIVLCVALVIGIIVLVSASENDSKFTAEEGAVAEESMDSSQEETIEDEKTEGDEGSEEENIDWLSKEYVVVSLYNKKTKKTTDIASGYGLKVSNSGTLVDVNDELGHYWAQEWIDDDIEVKMEKYGKGAHDVTVTVNGSLAANGENICVDGGTSLLNVHPLMDQSKYDAQTWLEDDDIVEIKVK